MRSLPRVTWLAAALAAIGCLLGGRICFADEREQVEFIEQLTDQFEKTNKSAEELSNYLARVNDGPSGDTWLPKVSESTNAYATNLRALVPLLQTFKQIEGSIQTVRSQEFAPRAKLAAQRMAQLEKDWPEQLQLVFTHVVRISRLDSLSSRFLSDYMTAISRLIVTMFDVGAAIGTPVNAEIDSGFRRLLSMFEKYGYSKICDVVILSSDPADLKSVSDTLRKSLGPSVQLVFIPMANNSQFELYVAPVDRLADIASVVNLGRGAKVNEARRAVIVESSIDLGPDWPELDQIQQGTPRFGQTAEIQPLTKEQLYRKYGPGKIVHVEVTNAQNLTMKDKLTDVISAAAPESKFIRHNGGRAYLGPVDNFDAFCKALDIGEIIERDDSKKVLRLIADPDKYFAKAGGVRIELVNNEEFNKYSREAMAKHFESMRNSRGRSSDKTMADDREDPTWNLGVMLRSAAAPTKFLSYNLGGGKIVMGPVGNFEAFCDKLDFAVIVERDPIRRSLKIRVDLDRCTGEEAAKRISLDSPLEASERERLGLSESRFSHGIGARSNFSGISKLATNDQPSTNRQSDYETLADQLLSTNPFDRNEAMRILVSTKPESVEDKETRKKIARNFREIAFNEIVIADRGKAIRGLVVWGGKFSVPILVDLLSRERLHAPQELYEGLIELNDPLGAEAVSKRLGNFFDHDAAVGTLRRMGPVAEDALIKAAPSNDATVSLAAIELLGDAGTEKCLPLLNRAATSRNPEVRKAAMAATGKIKGRQKSESK